MQVNSKIKSTDIEVNFYNNNYKVNILIADREYCTDYFISRDDVKTILGFHIPNVEFIEINNKFYYDLYMIKSDKRKGSYISSLVTQIKAGINNLSSHQHTHTEMNNTADYNQIDMVNELFRLSSETEKLNRKLKVVNDIVSDEGTVYIRTLATQLTQRGIMISYQNLFKWLRDFGWLCRSKAYFNTPTQKGLKLGFFKTKLASWSTEDNPVPHISSTPKLTGKGLKYFIEELMYNKSLRIQEYTN